jgi:predicted DNA-binding transcriptional regulator AlpA
MSLPDYLTMEEACQMAGLSKPAMYVRVRRGDFLAAQPFGRCKGWRIFRESFERWLVDRIGKTSNRRATR